MKEIATKIYNIAFVFLAGLVMSGCAGGGGGSLGFLGDTLGGGSGSGGGASGGSGIATYHSPEPSSLILLGSGLIGMAIYAKAKLKSKGKV